MQIKAPFNGQIVALTDIPDQVFAEAMMGQGCGLEPEIGAGAAQCLSPIDGQIVTIMAHAYVVRGDEGAVLVHCGIDTVHMGDEWSEILVRVGDQVKAGDPVLRLKWNQIDREKYHAVSPVVGVESRDFQFAAGVSAGQTISAGQELGTLHW